MTSAEIRQSFLEFFRVRQHTILPSASLLPTSPNLLFTNAGMNPFVPYFLGTDKPTFQPPRVADTQKCIRASGKHNDLEDVGLDTYHHTLFEMLGNWSFGDYFKKEAIEWAWELVVKTWKFPPQRLYATVYRPGPGDPAEFDNEAHALWSRLFTEAGLDPDVHVVNGNKDDNFWMMGETGPCGPCSELHMDLTPLGDTKGSLVNAGDARCIEIWNLVFIQFNANADGTFSPLSARHVDTGMGFERVCSIIQGTKSFTDFSRPVSNYDTDVFIPIIRKLESLSGTMYRHSVPADGKPPHPNSDNSPSQEQIDVAFRVIADHIRTLCCAIADGILPSNKKRGYVLRSILRRAVRFGRTLGLGSGKHLTFLADLSATVGEQLGSVFPELIKHQERIRTTLIAEEEAFNKTLDKGIELFLIELTRLSETSTASDAGAKVLDGDFAFKLFDTFGFPLDLTRVMAREHGLSVDETRFRQRMDEQRERSQEAQVKDVVLALTEEEVGEDFKSEFVGYAADKAPAKILSVRRAQIKKKDGENVELSDQYFVSVDCSPLYVTKGGQIGDHGVMEFPDVGMSIPIVDTIQRGQTLLLQIDGSGVDEDLLNKLQPSQSVVLSVDPDRRRAIERHHTATHILHWALHQVVGPELTQQGSYVGPDRLRFDVNSAKLSPEQVAKIERLVNERVLNNEDVSWTVVRHSDVKNRTDIMQFFTDKYGENVRVVQIGGAPGKLDGYSMELCGGTHVRRTGQIGLFKIISEGAIAAGVRRIEAVAGHAAYDFVTRRQFELLAKTAELEEKLNEANKLREKELAQAMRRVAEELASKLETNVNTQATPARLVAKVDLNEHGADLIGLLLETFKSRRFRGIVVLAGATSDGSVHLGVSVSEEFSKEHSAGKIVQQLAPIVGGKGGGRPDIARGAGKDSSKLEELIAAATAA